LLEDIFCYKEEDNRIELKEKKEMVYSNAKF